MSQERDIKVFVSYRRDDADFVATALCEKLKTMLGEPNVFMDVDSIPAGQNFRKHLQEAVGGADVLLALIGDRWLDIRDERGQRRLDQASDWVRLELEAAFELSIPVVPVLIGVASVPKPEQLPASLEEIAYRQAVPLRSGRDFSRDAETLALDIRRTLGRSPPDTDRTGRSDLARSVARPAITGAIAAIVVVIGSIVLAIALRATVFNTSRNVWNQLFTMEAKPVGQP